MDFQSISLNIVGGNVGKDPKITTFQSGDKQASFSLATTEKYKTKSGEVKELTEWHSIVCNGTLAGIVEKTVTKGSFVIVKGKNKTRSYEKDGVKHYVTEIIASDLTFIGGKKAEASEKPDAPAQNAPGETDDLPF